MKELNTVKIVALMLLSLTVILAACVETESEPQEDQSQFNSPQGGKADSINSSGFREFLSTVYCEPDTEICVVDGDIPLQGREALAEYHRHRVARTSALTVMRFGEVDSIWDTSVRHDLTFCISDKFGERKPEVRDSLFEAIADWEEVAHLSFVYQSAEDGHCDRKNSRVLFNVSPSEASAPYLARAFFPGWERDQRELLINLEQCDSMVNHPDLKGIFSLAGVLRHELGHVLGFRHEHTRPTAQAPHCFEDSDYRPLTQYDSRSVMHYPQCNGKGNWSLKLTDLDRTGAAFFYPDFGGYSAGRCQVELRNGALNEVCLPVVHQILELANTASFDVLDNWVKLDVRAVEALIELREVSPFNTIEKLRAIPFLEDQGLVKMYTYLYVDGRCPVEVDEDTGLIDPSCMPVKNRILELANNASFKTLDEEVPLDIRAAANLVAIREYRPFIALSELWEVSYVKTRALQAMYLYTLPVE